MAMLVGWYVAPRSCCDDFALRDVRGGAGWGRGWGGGGDGFPKITVGMYEWGCRCGDGYRAAHLCTACLSGRAHARVYLDV